MEKPAPVAHPIEGLLRRRWSPRTFAPKAVERDVLNQLFEAARWAPSSYNEQPWRYIITTTDTPERLQQAQSVLNPGNAWATKAPVLICTVANLISSRNAQPNRHALHDLGAASEHIMLQAVALGLFAHQMAGFNEDKARQVFQIPDGYGPVAMMAVGYPTDPATLTSEEHKREEASRIRRPIEEFVSYGSWGEHWGEPLTP